MQRTNRSRGIVTTELALGLLFVITVLAFCCGLLGLAIMQGECEDLATQVARMEARGDHAAAARAEAGAPADARVSLRTEGGWVVVVVSAERAWGAIGPVRLQAEARMLKEPGV